MFEHLDREHDDELRLAQRRQDSRPSLEDLLDAGHFDRKGWQWPAHQPLLEAAHASGATWIARTSRGLPHAGWPAPRMPRWSRCCRRSSKARAGRKKRSRPRPGADAGALRPAATGSAAGIARIQRLRDAALAQPLLEVAERRTALAGNGHVRRDYGVPRYLLALEREALVIGFEEAAGEPAEAQGEEAATPLAGAVGAARAADFARAYDLVCLTLAAGRTIRSKASRRSIQQRRCELPRAECLQVFRAFAHPDEVDRHRPLAAGEGDRGDGTPLGGAVELGDDEPGELQRLVERLHLRERVLAGVAVDDEQHLVRCALPAPCRSLA